MSHLCFSQLLTGRTAVVLDGATGTHLQEAGMAHAGCPEAWVLDHPDVLRKLQLAYMQAGSEVIYAFTFGANRYKLSQTKFAGAQDPAAVIDINRRLSEISIQVRDTFENQNPDRTIYVAGDLAPTGLFLQPAGDLSFNDLVDAYRQQVLGQLAAGVDLFVIETMMDLAQTRAAILAVRSLCDHPILASMTVTENGRTLSGNPPLSCLLTCAGMGVAAFGLNCSFGPEKLNQLIVPLLSVSTIPLFLKPNAGLPQLVEGRTIFPMDAGAFATAMKQPLVDGVRLIGGCCGTGPQHIEALSQLVQGIPLPAGSRLDQNNWICSSKACLKWQPEDKVPVVSPSDVSTLVDDVLDMETVSAPLIIDFTHLRDTDQLADALQELQLMTDVPLIFRCHQEEIADAALQAYHGRAGLLTSLEQASFRDRYGAYVVYCPDETAGAPMQG